MYLLECHIPSKIFSRSNQQYNISLFSIVFLWVWLFPRFLECQSHRGSEPEVTMSQVEIGRALFMLWSQLVDDQTSSQSPWLPVKCSPTDEWQRSLQTFPLYFAPCPPPGEPVTYASCRWGKGMCDEYKRMGQGKNHALTSGLSWTARSFSVSQKSLRWSDFAMIKFS